VPTYARETARVLLVDDKDRLLLQQSYQNHKRPKLGHCWLTVGGGVDPGETLIEAAVRELFEETGLRLHPDQLAHVAYAEGDADFGWLKGRFRDNFFVGRVDPFEIDTSNFAWYETRHIIGYRWWTVDELDATDEVVYPLGLVPLLRQLLAGEEPAELIMLPWHH
jgi:8-oxo-dGTP pyrophosphatase MutT (NUDIX family)